SAPLDVLAEVAYELGRVEAATDERLVEVDDQIDAPIVHGTDDHAGRLLLLPEAIRQLAQCAPLERLRLSENDATLVLHDLELCGGGLRPRLLRLFPDALELRTQLVRLANRRVEIRMCLARRDCLDPPRASADRAFREDHAGTDLRGRPDVSASAELAREAGDLDDPHLSAVLLAEQQHRPQPACLADRDQPCPAPPARALVRVPD